MFATLDLAIFVLFLALVMAVGLIAGRREDSSEDYFLAGRSIPWWGVAGSIFGTNVSANHIVGMMGIGFSIGFAQTHFEIGAVLALLILAYIFLPVYLNLRIFTLSEYLGKRYGQTASLLYTIILIVLILVQMTAAFYIGSRSLILLLQGTMIEPSYIGGVWILVFITSAYTIFGGLKAVVWTDVIQSALLLIAGIIVAVLTFAQPEVGGWSGMMAADAARPAAEQKMHLYLPSDHPELPWTGALTGLLFLHVFFWGTNQYLVQRALAAKSVAEARVGIFTGGFLKLLVPFFSIAGGIAAAQLFTQRLDVLPDPDETFPVLVSLVIPQGYGIVGIVLAGLMGAIISTIDSMMNSAATLTTIDIYKRYFNPNADDTKMILVGRLTIAAIVLAAALAAITTYDPSSNDNFFLAVSAQSSYFTPGLVAAFVLGMFYRGARPTGAVAAIVATPFVSVGIQFFYNHVLAETALSTYLGAELNFMHRVAFVTVAMLLLHVVVSAFETRQQEREQYLWIEATDATAAGMRRILTGFGVFLIFHIVLATLMVNEAVVSSVAAWISAVFTLSLFIVNMRRSPADFYRDDRFFAGLLSAGAMFIMFYFY